MSVSKLTLSADKDTIQLAKTIASESNISVSKLFKILITERSKKKKKEINIKPVNQFPDWMQQLIIAKEPTSDFDHKIEYHKHLDEKYGL
ncbi:DUF6364 family protein [Mucilaginibacter phyllosphaerae]|uniref:Uncharacterized protein n=1 Tax=Mucilaginibacter phyllosphaerae TaxID=1812349 RepID=A0A4Y8AF63_9SPHI|nr:DUF6364 family protein [Mucilaginibacter phyllosphaerae]MBB3968974.1 hypothetical protein [Mucilaginibacter phyllosphaerae]TEW67404.1 hypothetical protein E2R65_05290 [Mucilaginibacter phyllosphaerae]GGH23195.1 hypothetical protein GCM10007352_36970 [Mucilaginibacter phyllosphaerae]